MQLAKHPRLPNDDDICLGNGGAQPTTQAKSDAQAIIITGPPASGKSSIASKLADEMGAYILDSDYAKRMLPEFSTSIVGANLVHDESRLITFGSKAKEYEDEYNLYDFNIAKKNNVVIPKIGYNTKGIRKLRDKLIERGYEVHLCLVSLDRQKSSQRALYRFLGTKRYVPLSLVFDSYSNEPILSFYRMMNDKEWESVGKASTDTPDKRKVEVLFSSQDSPVNILRT